jgi:hypothetical protein
VHRGWPHVFVCTSRAVCVGAELTVEYPRGFWRGRAGALEAYAAADAAIDAGAAAAAAAAALPAGDADKAARRTAKKARAAKENTA